MHCRLQSNICCLCQGVTFYQIHLCSATRKPVPECFGNPACDVGSVILGASCNLPN